MSALSASICLSLSSTPASAAIIQSSLMQGAAPLAIALGATALGIGATIFALVQKHKNERIASRASTELATLRANLDQFESMLTIMPEITILWVDGGDPRVFGDIAQICGPRCSDRDVLNFANWLADTDAQTLQANIVNLLSSGRGFEATATTHQDRLLRVVGRASGAGAALRLRLASIETANLPTASQPLDLIQSAASADPSGAAAMQVLAALRKPAWLRNAQGQLVFVNEAYRDLATDLGLPNTDADDLPELFSARQVSDHLASLHEKKQITIASPLAEFPQLELILFPLEQGTAGYLGHVQLKLPNATDLSSGEVPGIIDALGAPVIVYSPNGDIVHFNRAYAHMWDLDENWLRSGVDEKQVLDKLRTKNLLPAVADYQGWRKEHLKNYGLREATEQTWHIPDGRTINFVVAPAAGDGGLIYVFEDVTERLRLESEKKALVNVQRETLNALSEGVAVFSTDGRLRLHNPRVSALWKLPLNKLGQRPHINDLADEMATAFPEDGRRIWAELKSAVINLSPQRDDLSGRINRSDGRLIDYAAIHLPDGQTMLTFVDVTQSTNYERMLKERNEALEMADRLKDAFVQSVSYELRSPLTNIIGFADLLASDTFGPLNERQRKYTDYIRASSATLGVLIDNILDLTHVDAGIAELNVEPHHISELVKKARAGLDATFMASEDEQPINLLVNIPDDMPVITVDSKRIVQVLYNLLSNAAKFSEPGSQVTLSAETSGEFVRLIVEDEGFGVPAELRASLFQRFEGRSIEGRQRGVGLGLTIAQAFVNLHGGKISIEDREPQGTRIIVTLPVVTQIQAGLPQADLDVAIGTNGPAE